jgi:hypothetical protein
MQLLVERLTLYGKKCWRRECDWDPTVSKFVARILLGRVRLGSNCRPANAGELASVEGISAALKDGVMTLVLSNLSVITLKIKMS